MVLVIKLEQSIPTIMTDIINKDIFIGQNNIHL